jgi:hypothetical protein
MRSPIGIDRLRNVRLWPAPDGLECAELVRSPRGTSDVDLFRYCQRVIDLYAEVSDGTLDLGMPQ